jgi:hypothetical protein
MAKKIGLGRKGGRSAAPSNGEAPAADAAAKPRGRRKASETGEA